MSCTSLAVAFTLVYALSVASLHADDKAAETVGIDDPLLDFSDWEKYRSTVRHPVTRFLPEDLERAKQNIARHQWARDHADSLTKTADRLIERLTPEAIEAFSPETTPGEILFTPCPACRDRDEPTRHPHGSWNWSENDPERLICNICRTVFPNEQYPEDVVLRTTWGRPQSLTFFGGEPMELFSYKTARSSASGHIRARKLAYLIRSTEQLAEAYAVAPEERYARTIQLILLRLADVFPYYLVHSGYNEFADMDPRIAAYHINNLPEPELVLPPNKPDHKLHTGYWTAGRWRAVGMDGELPRVMSIAYDLTCDAHVADGTPLYSDEQRRHIERNLLLESVILLIADKQINNKSVSNRTAAAMVGLCVGHPGLVRFGLEGFHKTLHEWYLPDGHTPESPSYSLMTLGGIVDMGQLFRNYSDPPGYRDAQGKRLDNVNLYSDPAYAAVWEATYQTLQGDLRYPPFADSRHTVRMTPYFAEFMGANYPEKYLGMLKEIIGPQMDKGHHGRGLFYRPPDINELDAPPVSFPDLCPPELRIGFMRTGETGRDSLLLLSASHWGTHHHWDSLNLYYWKQGRELLTDLGYLWDHPDRRYLYRTVAHNLVVIDQKEQRSKERGGEVHFFAASPRVKAMRASSQAYEDAGVYERTAVLIDHGDAGSYAFDCFRVQGGQTQDYVFHGPNMDYQVSDLPLTETSEQVYDFTDARQGGSSQPWRIAWKMDDQMTFTATALGAGDETVLIAAGWGQRDHLGKDKGVTIPYVIRRTTGDARQTFVTLFEGHAPGKPLVQSLRRLDAGGATAVETITRHGVDYIVSQDEIKPLTVTTSTGQLQTSSLLTVVSLRDGQPVWHYAVGDNPQLSWNGRPLQRW